MKKYQVEIIEKIVFQVSVEAANETEAENMARDQYDKGILEGNGEKEVDMNVVRGSRDFISGLIAKGFSQNSKYKPGDQMSLFDDEEFTKGIGNS